MNTVRTLLKTMYLELFDELLRQAQEQQAEEQQACQADDT